MPEIGQTLSHFRILEKIGEGGMGTVFLAEDLTLDRKVALKFLPEAFTSDPERMARFEREAKLLASLNHPNIAGIYGLEQADGNRFLVLEYAEGETLQARLSKGALPLEDALNLCRQIAEGLEAAHEKGVIHRDLKPANVMITADEKVKILDFGLAKAFSDETQGIDSSKSPTLTEAMTRPGVILGTAAYMSPEQAKGKSVDKRADIWAFGCILYESLTGKRVFEGETVTEMLAAVLKEEPNWNALPSAIPQNIRFVLRRCLEKERLRRFGDAGSVRIIISESKEVHEKGSHNPIWQQPLGWMLILITTVSIVYALWPKPVSFSGKIALMLSLPDGQEISGFPAISPDGQTIAYVSRKGTERTQLYLRDINSFETRVVTDSYGAEQPFFKPDGKWIAFFSQGKLLKAEVTGGSPVELCEARTPFGGTWNEDDTIIFTKELNSGLWRIPSGGGEAEPLTIPNGADQEHAHVWPQALPGGRSILFFLTGKESGTAVLSLDSGKWEIIKPNVPGIFIATEDTKGYLLSPDFKGEIKATPFDSKRLKRVGDDISVLSDVYFEQGIAKSYFTVSTNGTAVWMTGNPTKRSLAWVDRDGNAETFIGELAPYMQVAMDPNGPRILVLHSMDNIWIYDLNEQVSPERLILPENESVVMMPVWNNDGKSIYYASSREGDWDIYLHELQGSQNNKPVKPLPYDQYPRSVAPDGTLLYNEIHPKTGSDIWALSTDGKAKVICDSRFNEMNPVFSPDGRRIAYVSDENGRYDVYIEDFPSREHRKVVSDNGGTNPVWSHDGKELFYLAPDAMMAVSVGPQGSEAYKSRILFNSSVHINNRFEATYGVSADDKHFLMIQVDPALVMDQLNIVTNWFEELKQKVPIP